MCDIFDMHNVNDILFYNAHYYPLSCRDDLPKLEYLTQCIKESMRITAPVPGVGRLIQNDIKLPDGRVLPKGRILSVLISALSNPAFSLSLGVPI